MGDISDNISRHELACSCGCGFDTMDVETIAVVQEECTLLARDKGVEKVILNINSAARCLEYNRSPAVGSNDNSQHTKGRAMDILVQGVSAEELYDRLNEKYPDKYGMGLYNSFVHIDTRATKARW